MLHTFYCSVTTRRAHLAVAAVLLLALAAAGCGGGSIGLPTASVPASAPPAAPPAAPAAAAPATPSFKDKIASFFSSKSAKAPQPVANAESDVDCPYIDIRQGAATLTIPPPPPDGSNEAMTLKYQGDFVRAARECKVVGNQMVMRIGIQGRIIVGPAGGPGQVEVPLRIAVVSTPATGSKTIATKLIRIPVTIGGSDANATFTHIEDDFAFPMPSAAELDTYIVYIGFDPIGAAAEDRQKAPPVIKPKPRAKPDRAAPTG